MERAILRQEERIHQELLTLTLSVSHPALSANYFAPTIKQTETLEISEHGNRVP